MKERKPNRDLVKFAQEAKARKMTYGQLQQLETLRMLQELKQKEGKE